jgi:predicted transcriptional regulator
MALPEDCSVALLPIKPIYADAIVEGRKHVEFRKTRFRRRVTHVAIYASTPVQRIIGIFRVVDCEHASPERLWERHHAIGAISSADFNTYYADLETGVAIHIADVLRLVSPVPLHALRVRAPQSFRYLTATETARLRKAMAAKTPERRAKAHTTPPPENVRSAR